MLPPSPFVDVARARGAACRSYGGIELVETFTDPSREATRDASRGGTVRSVVSLRPANHRARPRDVSPQPAVERHRRPSSGNGLLRDAADAGKQDRGRRQRALYERRDPARARLDASRTEHGRISRGFSSPTTSRSRTVPSRSASLGIHGPRAPEILAGRPAGLTISLGRARARASDDRGSAAARRARRLDRRSRLRRRALRVETRRGSGTRCLPAGDARGLRPAGMAAADVLRLEAGRPRIGIDFDETCLVLEAALERGIHFSKGCYLGQEIVERASARGHVNKRLVGLRSKGMSSLCRGARIVAEGSEVGPLTSAAFSPHLGSTIALGYVKRAFVEPGNSALGRDFRAAPRPPWSPHCRSIADREDMGEQGRQEGDPCRNSESATSATPAEPRSCATSLARATRPAAART